MVRLQSMGDEASELNFSAVSSTSKKLSENRSRPERLTRVIIQLTPAPLLCWSESQDRFARRFLEQFSNRTGTVLELKRIETIESHLDQVRILNGRGDGAFKRGDGWLTK